MTNTPYSPPTGIMPAFDAFAISPSNSVDLPYLIRGIWVGATGDISLITPAGNTVLIVGIQTGYLLPIMAKRVRFTGTSASSLVGLI